jgi:hypothetical protein
MKKVLIQYLYIFSISLIMLCIFTILSACETTKVDETLPLCEELQVSTEEKPCRKQENINTVIKAIEKLGESGTLPR